MLYDNLRILAIKWINKYEWTKQKKYHGIHYIMYVYYACFACNDEHQNVYAQERERNHTLLIYIKDNIAYQVIISIPHRQL